MSAWGEYLIALLTTFLNTGMSAHMIGILAGLGFTFATGIEKLVGDLKRIQIILLVVVIILGTVYVISRFERRVIEEEKEFFAKEKNEDD